MQEPFLSRVSFFTLIQLIERYYQPAAQVGELGPAEQEIFRFRAGPSLAFPTRDVAEVKEITSLESDESIAVKPQYEVTANFLGLLGTVSPLPAFFSERVLQDEDAETNQRALFDLFHHRLLSLFYKAGLKYRYQFSFQEDCLDATSQRLLALAGFGPATSIQSAANRPASLLRYAGLLYHRPRSASVLQTALTDFLRGLRVAVTQCIPRWVPIQASQMVSLGRANGTLGMSAMVGSKVRTCVSSFRITLGPMPYEQFIRFLPPGSGFSDVIKFARLFITDLLDWDLELRVFEAGIPRVTVASTPPLLMGSRLGWTSWLTTSPVEDDSKGEYRTVILPAVLRREAA